MHASATVGRRRGGAWWLSPVGAVILVVPAGLALAAGLDDVSFRELYRTPKVLTGGIVTMFLTGALVFVLASFLPQLGERRRRVGGPLLKLTERQWIAMGRAADILLALTLLGYATWLASAVLHGLTPARLLAALLTPSSATSVEQLFVTVPGLTTLTQAGIPFVIVAVLLMLHQRGRWIALKLGMILVLTLLRAFLLTERLSLIELSIPIVVLSAAHFARSGSPWVRRAVSVAPLVLLPSVIVLFGALEYTRSWSFYSARTQQNYVEFTLTRIGGYYATAYNNGAIGLRHQAEPGRIPYGTVAGFWEAPMIGQLGLYQRLNGEGESPLLDENDDVLVLHGNPEYNSPGGLAVPFIDYGPGGGLAYLSVAGLLLGAAYRGFNESNVTAVLVYPMLATGLFELPRYLYWPQGRATPGFVALLALAFYLHRTGPRSTPEGGDPLCNHQISAG
ncbi:MAG: oligosaccharide repeat unit polymerase [Actinomycetota bacterium]|nr:oligosaccharide repeat unit polymerase [Actinomycetota bacterium]